MNKHMDRINEEMGRKLREVNDIIFDVRNRLSANEVLKEQFQLFTQKDERN